ncbi:copper chaperone PCu(A)C [Pseudomarimonas arenosa]|uniref:Copper chaperone PCu(A)C n=1 Tax=Pseudomarimonas arenosa TaxID=2774145 RepID=A0AAW3ZLD7_9GAMM|nr:copper chaperone PCu(A)C [Pseudomarimonas arenosa]MBD8526553.1 copper chaperone PCu(A)C [Pseudomarimonas arenosa]
MSARTCLNLMLSAALLLFSGSALAELKLKGSNAWIRLAPSGAMMLAGYVELRNEGEQPLRLKGGQSGAFGLIEIHRTEEVDGVSRMREVPLLEIAPGATVKLEPGGLHLMLMRPTGELAEGTTVAIDLLDENDEPLPVAFTVRREAPES